MGECVEDLESSLREVLLKLNETGISFSLKKEQESSMGHLFNGKDVMAVYRLNLARVYFFGSEELNFLGYPHGKACPLQGQLRFY